MPLDRVPPVRRLPSLPSWRAAAPSGSSPVFPITTDRATAAVRSTSSAQRYWVLRSSTFPDTGPVTRARNRPCSVRNASETPPAAHKPHRRRAATDLPEAHDALQRLHGHAELRFAFHPHGQRLAVLGEVRALCQHVQRIQKCFIPPPV